MPITTEQVRLIRMCLISSDVFNLGSWVKISKSFEKRIPNPNGNLDGKVTIEEDEKLEKLIIRYWQEIPSAPRIVASVIIKTGTLQIVLPEREKFSDHALSAMESYFLSLVQSILQNH